jgi:hypothetical protein
MIIDALIHCSGEEKTADVVRALDWAEVDKAIPFSKLRFIPNGVETQVFLPPPRSERSIEHC